MKVDCYAWVRGKLSSCVQTMMKRWTVINSDRSDHIIQHNATNSFCF